MKKLIRNAIRCKHCGDVLESKSIHDFVECTCGRCYCDGGLAYLRHGFTNSPKEDFEDLCEYKDVPGYHVEYIAKSFATYDHLGYNTDIQGTLNDVFSMFPQSNFYLLIKDENGNVVFDTITKLREGN